MGVFFFGNIRDLYILHFLHSVFLSSFKDGLACGISWFWRFKRSIIWILILIFINNTHILHTICILLYIVIVYKLYFILLLATSRRA